MADRDTEIKATAFAYVDRISEHGEGVVTWAELNSFSYMGERVHPADRTAKSSPSRDWTAQGMFSTAFASISPSSRPVGSAPGNRHRELWPKWL